MDASHEPQILDMGCFSWAASLCTKFVFAAPFCVDFSCSLMIEVCVSLPCLLASNEDLSCFLDKVWCGRALPCLLASNEDLSCSLMEVCYCSFPLHCGLGGGLGFVRLLFLPLILPPFPGGSVFQCRRHLGLSRQGTNAARMRPRLSRQGVLMLCCGASP